MFKRSQKLALPLDAAENRAALCGAQSTWCFHVSPRPRLHHLHHHPSAGPFSSHSRRFPWIPLEKIVEFIEFINSLLKWVFFMLASCLVAVLLGRHLTPGLWTSENFRKHTNVTNVAYKLYRAQDLYMCNARSDKTWSKGRTRENDRYNRYKEDKRKYICRFQGQGDTERRYWVSWVWATLSTANKYILQVEPQKRKKTNEKTAKKERKKEAKKNTVFQTLPIASRGTKR